MADARQVTMLLVDDDMIDRAAVVRAFRKRRIENKIIEATDGHEAMEILRREHRSKKIEGPFLILLDLSMPRMDGIEFLSVLRLDKRLANSIVFVLTTSSSDEDRIAAYNHHIAGYIVKSRFGEEFSTVIEMMELYWKVIEFP